jgi:hypothetical protein
MDRFKWSELKKPQLGRYAEYFVKMKFTLHGFDVYTAEVDDKGIDFVIRKEPERYFDIQVKSVRDDGLICLPLCVFKPKPNLFAAIVNFVDDERPKTYLIRSTEWESRKSKMLVHYKRPHEDKKEDFDEYQLRMKGHERLLEEYAFEAVVRDL